MKVFCYRNLHHKGVVWSVKNVKTGLVVDRATTVYLSNVKLKVSEAGRQRVLKQKRKNVHAGPQGDRLARAPPNRQWTRISYNPYVAPFFMHDTYGYPVHFAKYVKLTKNGCFISYE